MLHNWKNYDLNFKVVINLQCSTASHNWSIFFWIEWIPDLFHFQEWNRVASEFWIVHFHLRNFHNQLVDWNRFFHFNEICKSVLFGLCALFQSSQLIKFNKVEVNICSEPNQTDHVVHINLAISLQPNSQVVGGCGEHWLDRCRSKGCLWLTV